MHQGQVETASFQQRLLWTTGPVDQRQSLPLLHREESAMKSRWGNVRIVHDKFGTYVRGWRRKKYTRNIPYPLHIVRVPVMQREKAAIIKLRKLGYPINMISQGLGRSRSYVHHILRAAIMRLSLRPIDMRKLPSATRLRCSTIRWNILQRFLPSWEKWILGEGEKPP